MEQVLSFSLIIIDSFLLFLVPSNLVLLPDQLVKIFRHRFHICFSIVNEIIFKVYKNKT